MSCLYLDLRSRIPVMGERDWTEVPPDELRSAQKRAGKSDEEMAVDLHVTTKTWWRWRKQGRIPTTSVPAVARVLGLDLYEHFDSPTPADREGRQIVTLETVSDRLESLEASVADVAEQIRRALDLLDALSAPRARATGRSRS